MAGRRLDLPVVDLASSDLRAAAESVRQACVEYGFFYVINHGIDAALLERVFAESRRFFALPKEEKMALRWNSSHRGYTPPLPRGDSNENFYIGPMGDDDMQNDVNQWPSEECFPSWKNIMQSCQENALATSKRIMSLIALSLDLDAEFFQNNGAFEIPSTFLRLLHYSGGCDDGSIRAAAHSDFGMLTILATDGTPGLQSLHLLS